MQILKMVFAVLYSHYLALASTGYTAMSNKQLTSLTGFKKALFEDNGRAPILIAGIDLRAMKAIYDNYTTMTMVNQRKLRKDALTHLKQHKQTYSKKKIYKDFTKIFPTLIRSIDTN